MSHLFLQVNAFASRPFEGNPAAVVLLESSRPDIWMQLVAREFNVSETAFLTMRADEDSSPCHWDLRWFTPSAEVDLCGHATLASAHTLREWDLIPGDEITFHTRSGLLTARLGEDEIALDFPSMPPHKIGVPDGLAQVLGAPRDSILWCGRSKFDIVLQLDSEESVAHLEPDFVALRGFEARGVAVTASSSGGNCDFVSRFFAPNVGVDEDPVTGSAHCALAPFWAERLGKDALSARQISHRGGEIWLQVLGDRVELRGSCVTIFRGEVLA